MINPNSHNGGSGTNLQEMVVGLPGYSYRFDFNLKIAGPLIQTNLQPTLMESFWGNKTGRIGKNKCGLVIQSDLFGMVK